MIRRAVLAAALAATSPLAAQSERAVPPIAETALRDIDFVPFGWKLYDKAQGDLNGDGLEDSVLVIQRNEPSLVIENPDSLGAESYDANPRSLLFILSDPEGPMRLVGRDDTIIPDWDSPNLDNPLDSIDIGGGGKVTLWIRYWSSAGAWEMSNRLFHFRWDGEGMVLIGYDSIEVHRATLDFKEVSINYLTGRRKDVVGNMDQDKDEETWSEIDKSSKPVLGNIGNAFEFNP